MELEQPADGEGRSEGKKTDGEGVMGQEAVTGRCELNPPHVSREQDVFPQEFPAEEK